MIVRLVSVGVLSASLVAASVAGAQAPSGGSMPMGGQTGGATAPASPGMMPPGGMMGGMCPMMGGMMGMGMMAPGMMGGGQDPKMMGRMLQLRADMMRAMADVLARHGKALEEGK